MLFDGGKRGLALDGLDVGRNRGGFNVFKVSVAGVLDPSVSEKVGGGAGADHEAGRDAAPGEQLGQYKRTAQTTGVAREKPQRADHNPTEALGFLQRLQPFSGRGRPRAAGV